MNPLEFLQQNWFLVAICVVVLLMLRDPNNPISKALGLGKTTPKPQPQPQFTPMPQAMSPNVFLPPNAQVGQTYQLTSNGLVPTPAPEPPAPPQAPRAVEIVDDVVCLDDDDGMELEFEPTGIRLVDSKRGLKLHFKTGAVVPVPPVAAVAAVAAASDDSIPS